LPFKKDEGTSQLYGVLVSVPTADAYAKIYTTQDQSHCDHDLLL